MTSAAAGEGKSTLSINIAISIARNQQKVILIDADLRNPSVRAMTGIPEGTPGTIDILNGQADFLSSLVPYGRYTVDEEGPFENSAMLVLPGGAPVKNPEGIYGRESMSEILKKAGEIADVVIIDAPPCGFLADASALARKCDAGIMIVRQDYTRLERILESVEMLSVTGVNMLGYIMNNM